MNLDSLETRENGINKYYNRTRSRQDAQEAQRICFSVDFNKGFLKSTT